MTLPPPGRPAAAAPDPLRRALCAAALAPALPRLTQAQSVEPAAASAAAKNADSTPLPAPDPSRLALVIGNRRYPGDFDLPSIHKNARDVGQALQGRGFNVTLLLDAEPAGARQAVDVFVAQALAAPPDATLMFYFSGHGLQLDAENLLVGAGVAPDAPADSLIKGCLSLQRDLMQRLPRREAGLTIAAVDACRSDLRVPKKGLDGFNQVEAPPGCLITFSTGAGKPAIAPKNPEQSTFYTAALVRLLQSAPDDLTFSDLFKLVKIEVQRTMLSHEARRVREFAQYPFITENVLSAASVAPRNRRPAAPRFTPEEENRDWSALQASAWPADVIRAAELFRQRHPGGPRAVAAEVAAEGAREAAVILRRNDLRLYRSSFEPSAEPDAAYNVDLRKAARGDKDAAARVGRHWATTDLTGPALSRFEGWMQFAAELGNGIASYELALHYRRHYQPQPAARWESRARELGYTPPPTLDNRRK